MVMAAATAETTTVASRRPLRLLTFTTLYPNAVRRAHGVFVENRLRHLVAGGGVELRVVAPVPWFPFRAERFGRYAEMARVPAAETRHGVAIRHPRYPLLPKIGMTTVPLFLYLASRGALHDLQRSGYDFDLIDAHYFYPDGVAAALLGREFGKPVTITARGTDINLIPEHALPRRMILWAANRAAGLIAVCAALKERMVELGIAADRIRVLRNGVDLALFRPADRAAARARLGLKRRTLLSVGHLIERKGHHLVIEALASTPDIDLLIAGDGEGEPRLRASCAKLGVESRVRFLGSVPHEELPAIYGAADALVLASSREGWPNVLLEAMACGTPVVATRVWGSPEVVADAAAGELVEARTAPAIAAGIARLLARCPDRAATRRYAENFSWDETSRGQLELFRRIAADAGR